MALPPTFPSEEIRKQAMSPTTLNFEQDQHVLVHDAYDPILDPSYRLVKNWAQNYEFGLSRTSIVPLSQKVWMLFLTVNSEPAAMTNWSLVPHRDPSLQLWLARDFQLASFTLVRAADEKLSFPLEKEQTMYFLVHQETTVPTLAKAAKDVVRMMTGTTKKLTVTSPVNEKGETLTNKLFPQRLLPRDVNLKKFAMEIIEQPDVRAATKTQVPRVQKLEPDLGKVKHEVAAAWAKLALAVRDNGARFWHKGRLATMLSDEYWTYAVAQVAATMTEQKLKTMLFPAPVTQWWFQKLISWTLMDIMAVSEVSGETNDPSGIETIYEAWKRIPRTLSRESRRKAVFIRLKLGIPPFTAGQPEQAALLIAKMTFWVGRYMPKMTLLLNEVEPVGLDAALHPFWARKLRKDLANLWPKYATVAPSGKKGQIRINRNFPSFARETSTGRAKYVFDEEREGLTKLNVVLKDILEEKADLQGTTTDTILTWLQNIVRYREELCVPQLVNLNLASTLQNLSLKPVTDEDRWLLNMTFANAKAKATMDAHPWFKLIKHVALPEQMSDLA